MAVNPWSILVGCAAAIAGLLLALPAPAAAPAPKPDPNHKPTIYLIGDSTVRNGADNGSNGQWGWGHILPYYFDKEKVTVENHAVGGTSSRTFFQTPNMWPAVLAKLQPGDYVFMQFGHNDNTGTPQTDTLRYRSTIRGNGDEVVEGVIRGGGTEPVHSFGWYIRQYITQTKAKGAIPVVCSLIPRNGWRNGKNNRSDTSYGLWAEQAAKQGGSLFIPLANLISDRYDKLGQEKVTADYFPPAETTHTNWAGAKLNAEMVVEGVKAFKDNPLTGLLVADPKAPDVPDVVAGAGRGRGRGTTTSASASAPAQ